MSITPQHKEQRVVQPGEDGLFFLGSHEPHSRKKLNVEFYPVDVADLEVSIHRDQANDQTLWCKVHNRSDQKIYVVATVLGGSNADTPAA